MMPAAHAGISYVFAVESHAGITAHRVMLLKDKIHYTSFQGRIQQID